MDGTILQKSMSLMTQADIFIFFYYVCLPMSFARCLGTTEELRMETRSKPKMVRRVMASS